MLFFLSKRRECQLDVFERFSQKDPPPQSLKKELGTQVTDHQPRPDTRMTALRRSEILQSPLSIRWGLAGVIKLSLRPAAEDLRFSPQAQELGYRETRRKGGKKGKRENRRGNPSTTTSDSNLRHPSLEKDNSERVLLFRNVRRINSLAAQRGMHSTCIRSYRKLKAVYRSIANLTSFLSS